MPRVNLGRPDPKDARLKTIIDGGMNQLGITSLRKTAEKAGMPYSTLRMKYRSPEKFNVGELRRVFNALQIKAEERTGII